MRLRLEARAFLGIESTSAADHVRHTRSNGRRPPANPKSCRLKHFLEIAEKNSRATFQPRFMAVVEDAVAQKRRSAEPEGGSAGGATSRSVGDTHAQPRGPSLRRPSMDSISETSSEGDQ